MSILDKAKDLDNPLYYNNREISWLDFNKRVLEEAFDNNNPLLERFRFLAIFTSNLDEFFMVRVAGLKDQVKAGFNKMDNKSGLTPKQQLERISQLNHQLVEEQYNAFDQMQDPLNREGISILSIDSLSHHELAKLEEYFDEHIFPVLTPMAIDAYRPFPMLLNKSLNIAVVLEKQDDYIDLKRKTAIVQVPALLDRYININDNNEYVFLEDLIGFFIHKFFKGYQVLSITEFRITRNADMTIHEEGARDLLKEIEKELKKRKWGSAVRLEVRKEKYDQNIVEFLLHVLEIHKGDLYYIKGPLDLSFLFKFYNDLFIDHDHLVFQTLIPQAPRDIEPKESVFEAAKKRDIFLHHPYESFVPVIDLVVEAADDPDVLAIKQTLYRVSGDSPIIAGLKRAAEKGKQVTVLVELKARFDEEKNVQWAKELEKSGCHVIYGMNALKTHSKITLIVRRRFGKIERFVHLGTGNYNDQTANFYTDMSLITTKRKFGVDATNFFNYLSGYTETPKFHHIAMAPFDIRSNLIKYINDEIQFHKTNGNGRIIAKMNSLTDKPLIKKFYEASQAGVKVDLIIRGICCLRPGIKDISDNIRVHSIVGRFLEHSRIYYFHHNGEEKIFLSSADLMTRNMVKRVEILFPIYEGAIKSRIKKTLLIMLQDNVKTRVQLNNGNYRHIYPESDNEVIDSQMVLYNMAYRLLDDEE
ncbi:RNA degradosome polyphosphate kinase [Aquibacillus rhizosphaerae]|uniref:Polyphosphate kinase n=1 Tax=Aquibacillus rhizosphaerae TaxID=3051431 RepID=A0ABT7L7L0_9BACI|nr:RNA degradosome polyphosphate kinase [Aquibacillus sp. LR5S19]MDL4841839.1 RNA degradosome polyphosphate kinase [Aquibacillus sp. LR5S19]